jgi:hypothetical protein
LLGRQPEEPLDLGSVDAEAKERRGLELQLTRPKQTVEEVDAGAHPAALDARDRRLAHAGSRCELALREISVPPAVAEGSSGIHGKDDSG